MTKKQGSFKKMLDIFISYRQSDSLYETEVLYREIVKRFGQQSVFRDVNSNTPGENYKANIDHAIQECKVVLAVIGKNWAGRTPGRKNRLNDPDDLVRRELNRAIRQGKMIIPILLYNVSVPKAEDLPHDLVALPEYHAIRISASALYEDIEQLLVHLEQAFRGVHVPIGGRRRCPQCCRLNVFPLRETIGLVRCGECKNTLEGDLERCLLFDIYVGHEQIISTHLIFKKGDILPAQESFPIILVNKDEKDNKKTTYLRLHASNNGAKDPVAFCYVRIENLPTDQISWVVRVDFKIEHSGEIKVSSSDGYDLYRTIIRYP